MPLYEPNEYYKVLSKYWDKIYKDKTLYQQAFNFIETIRQKEGLPKEIADVACGTGILLKIFEQAGYEIIGSDLSPEMLNQAKLKISGKKLLQESYEEVCLPKQFSMIVSFFNSFAYCQDRIALSEVLNHLRSQLTPNGLIFFDLFTTDKSKEIFHVNSFSIDNNIHLSRTFLGYPKENNTFHSYYVFTVFENRQPQTFTTESIRGIFTEGDVRWAIDTAGFDLYYTGSGLGFSDTRTFVGKKITE
jgi:SAM-dependent methyltransferase